MPGGIGGGGAGGGPGGMGNIFNIGKANPATKASTSSVRFKDVAGCEEGKVCAHRPAHYIDRCGDYLWCYTSEP